MIHKKIHTVLIYLRIWQVEAYIVFEMVCSGYYGMMILDIHSFLTKDYTLASLKIDSVSNTISKERNEILLDNNMRC